MNLKRTVKNTVIAFTFLICSLNLIAVKPTSGLELPKLKKSDVLVKHTGFSLVYSEKDEQALWVAYTLTKELAASDVASREGKSFRTDPQISTGSADDKDYTKSGYSRGHLCPANDNTWSEAAMYDCFYFSNMSPQKQDFNNAVWKKLELYVHDLALQYDTLYIATGPVLKTKKPFKKFGANEVSVPDYFYKVIMVYGTEPKAIGYIIPQVGYSKNFEDYACSVDKVEKVTGVDFYFNLPDKTEKRVESIACEIPRN